MTPWLINPAEAVIHKILASFTIHLCAHSRTDEGAFQSSH